MNLSSCPVEATKFGGQPQHASEAEQILAFAKRLRQACKDAWILLDAIGLHATDEVKLAVLKISGFATALHGVRLALILTRSLDQDGA